MLRTKLEIGLYKKQLFLLPFLLEEFYDFFKSSMSVTKKEILVEKLEIHHMLSAWEKIQVQWQKKCLTFQRTVYQIFASCCAEGKIAMPLRES